MRIVGINTGDLDVPRAIHIYRVTQPLGYINNTTKHEAGWMDTHYIASKASAAELRYLAGADIIVVARPVAKNTADAKHYIDALRKHSPNALLVYETDDDLSNIYRDVSGGSASSFMPYLPLVDAVTVSTEPLAAMVRNFTKENTPVGVLPNCIDIELFNRLCRNTQDKTHDGINIMFLGTATHGDDWNVANQAVQRVLGKHNHVKLLVGGYHPDYIKESDQVRFLPFVEYRQYPLMLQQADIVIAAIDPDNQFNQSKSAVKAMESWASKRLVGKRYGGAAVIATDSVVYRGTVKNGVNGLLCKHTADDYETALTALIEDDALRHRIQVRGHRDVAKHHNIKNGYRKWLSFYTHLLRSKQ